MRQTLAWLVETRRLAREQVADILEEVKDPNAYLVSLAYDALPEMARRAARTLALARSPSKANGSFGSFAWSDAADAADAASEGTVVRREDVRALERAGLLTRDDERAPAALVMGRRARSFIASMSRALDQAHAVNVHRALACFS